MKTRIHVNQHNIKANARRTTCEAGAKGANLPVLTVKTYKDNTLCNGVIIHGPSRVVYSPEHPLSCGARVWVETQAEVETL